jgi:hypothetical protein
VIKSYRGSPMDVARALGYWISREAGSFLATCFEILGGDAA